jgi:cell division protein FtsI (penicillin-binding protein 3)
MSPRDQILTRMYMVMTLLSVVPVFVVGQVGWILLSRGDALQAQGQKQAQSTVEVPAMRGAILDRNGRALAINTARYDLALDPTVGNFSERASTFYERLASLTGEPASRFREKVDERHSPQYVRLYRGLTAEQREEVRSWGVEGVILTPRFARRYNYGTTAAHVLGHVNAEGTGLAGLELEYNEALTGTPGRRAVKRDRSGRIKAFVGGKVVEPEHGESLRLTVDLARQAALEDELRRGVKESGAAWGTAIAMDPNTGAVLAMANVPTYDPNQAAAAPDAARRNRAITDRFEPGSTFKLVGAAAAVGQGAVAMGDSVETGDGWAVFHGYTMKDVRAHGTISFADVIAKSSNVGMAKTASRLDRGTFYQYARNLGFGQPTMIDLPGEVGGVLKRPSQWSSTTLTSMSIGYEVAVTPIQLLAAYSALANGGHLVQPYLVAERQDVTGETLWANRTDSIRRAISQATARRLRPAFERVVEDGTGTEAKIEGLDVAGKTGTALKVAGGDYSKDRARASFVGFFPADRPSVAVLVIIGEPETSIYGGQVAAPVFRRIARRWADTFPRVTDRLAQAADSAATPEPPASSAPLARAPDRLAEASGDAMPDLRGVSARRAVHWLRRHGVGVRLRGGDGVVTRQVPAPGADLPGRAVLRCAAQSRAGAR